MTLFSEQVRALSVGLRFHNQGGIFHFGGRGALPKAVIPAPRAKPILLFPQDSSRASTARSISRALRLDSIAYKCCLTELGRDWYKVWS